MKLKNNTRFLIACILIVVIVISGIIVSVTDRKGNVAKGPDVLKDPVAVTVGMEVKTNGLTDLLGSVLGGSASGYTDMLDGIIDIANNMSFVATMDGSDMQLDVLLKGEKLLYAAMRGSGDGITVVSDMLPDNSLLFISSDELIPSGSGKPVDIRFTTDDVRMLRNTVRSRLIRLADQVASRAGNEEKGSWTFEEQTFTSRSRISLTAKEAAVLLLEALKDLAEDTQVSALLTRMGVDPASLELDREIAEIQSRPEDSFPVLTAYRYGNGHDTWTEMTLADDDVSAGLRYGIIGSDTVVRLSCPPYISADLVADSLGYGYSFSAAITAQGSASGYSHSPNMTYTVSAQGITEQNGESTGSVTVGLAGLEFLSLDYTVSRGNKPTVSFERNGRQVLTVQDLDSSAFSQQMQARAMSLLNRITTIMPEAASGLMQSFFGMMQ